MNPVQLTYAVGILNYNTRDLLLENIGQSLTSGIPAERLVVLDNQSTDGSAEAVRERYPRVRLVVSPGNLGYAGGMNKIVELSGTDLVVLVTADCFVTMDTVQQLVSSVVGRNDLAVVGCRIIDKRTGNIQSEGADVTYPLGLPLARNWQKGKDTPASPSLVECAYVQGAAMLVNVRNFREIGSFDESYFAYYEEVDLCWRARLRGYRVAALGSAVGLHFTYGSFGRFPETRWMLFERNRIATNLKNLDVSNLLVFLLYEALYSLAITVGSSFYRLSAYRVAYYKGLVSLLAMRSSVLRERRRVQRERQRTDLEILALHPKVGLRSLLPALSQRITVMDS
jgi:GT2 family glycosyltransferase